MAAKRFEELTAWQKARELNRSVYRMTNTAPCRNDFALIQQIRRASISVMNNIAEGFDRYSRPQFIQFLNIARGSCAEVRSMIHAAGDVGYLSLEEQSRLVAACEETSRVISGLQASARRPKETTALPRGPDGTDERESPVTPHYEPRTTHYERSTTPHRESHDRI